MEWSLRFGDSSHLSQFAPPARRVSSARHMTWLAVVIIVVSGCLLAAALLHLRHETLESAERLTQALARVIAEQTSRTFQGVDQRLQLAAGELNDLEKTNRLNEDSARSVLKDQLRDFPFVRAIWVLDNSGRVVFDSDKGHLGIEFRDTEYFQSLLRQPAEAFHIGVPIRSRTAGTWLMSASKPLFDATGALKGAIVATVEPSYVDTLWRDIDLGPDGAIALFRTDGTLMMRSPAQDDAIGKAFAAQPLFTEQLPRSAQGTFMSTSAVDNRLRTVSYRVLAPYPRMVVSVGRLEADVLAPWTHFAMLSSVVWLGASATAALLLTLLYRLSLQSERTELRFRQLAQAMPQIVFIWDAHGELQFLGEQWTAMTGQPSGAGMEYGPLEWIHPQDRAGLVATRDQALRTGTVAHHEHRLRCADGSYRWQLMRVLPNRNARGRIVSWYGTATDIDDLKQAEAALQAQTAMTRMAGRIARLGGWALDLQTMRFAWSDETALILDIPDNAPSTLEAALGLYAPQSRALARQVAQDCLENGTPYDIEVEMVTGSGRAIWVRSMAEAVRDEKGQIVRMQGALQDITESRQLALALRESEQRQAALFEAAPVPMWVMESETCRHIAVNEAAVGHYGYSRDEFMRLTSLDLRPGKEQERFRQLMAGGLPMRQLERWTHRRKDGSEFTAELVRRPIRWGGREAVFAVAFDISARVQAENANNALLAEVRDLNAGLEERITERTLALSRQEALFRALAEQAPFPFWTVEPDGQATFVSRAWYELAGGTAPDWHGHAWMDLVHPDDVAEVQHNWRNAREQGSAFTGTRRLRARDGTYHTTTYRAVPVRNEAGEITFWVGIDADITELKAIEAALRQSNAELEAFSYSASHDLRSPLAAIAGFSHLLERELGPGDGKRARHFVSRIQTGVTQMSQLIEGLLSLAQVSRAELRQARVDLSQMASGILERLQTNEPARAVTWTAQPGLEAWGDSRLLRSLLENLLGNAWKFSARTDRAEIAVGWSDAHAAFFVRDNGAGFDMAHAGKLFGTFQRLHSTSEFAGTGIGLATTARIVTRHGGRIWADSAPGQGATFFFTLPATGA